jgi:radical SAM protein with 4Fe4S-binding SPASM domain
VPVLGCNLRCRYCQFVQDFDGHAGRARMTTTQARGLVERFYELSAGAPPRRRDFVFFGGEPFLAPDIVTHVMREIREDRGDGDTNLLAFTNGVLVTDQTAATCARYGLYAIVSIDGPPAVHDRARVDVAGRGSGERALAGYRRLKAAGCRTAISVMLGRHNAGTLRESVRWLIDELAPDELGIAGVFHPLGRARNPYQVDAADAVTALVETYRACRERGVYVDQVARRLRPFVAMRPKLKDCMACGGKVVATPAGIRGSCEYIAFRRDAPRRPLGTLEGDRPEDWQRRSAIWSASCQRCPALGICGGGCPYNALQLGGALDARDEDHCAQTRLLLGWMLGDLFRACARRDAFRDGGVVVPTPADRQALFGAIVDHEALPLRTVSTHGEHADTDSRG